MSTSLAPIDQKVAAVSEQVSAVVERARAIEVRTPEEATAATEFLAEIKSAQTRSEKARKFIVDPFNAQIKAINARFKETAAPLDEADKLVRGKVIEYRERAEAEARAEQDRIDAERRAAEEQAEAERRRLAQEAAEAEQEAARAERARQAEMAAAASDRRREIAAMDDEALYELAVLGVIDEDSPESRDARMAEDELAARKTAREAQERAARARQEAEEAGQREIAAKSAPALEVAPVAALASQSGAASVRKEWKATVVDQSLLPAEYLIPDMAKINKVVKAGVREIPGVLIEQVSGLSVRAAR